MTHAAHLRRGCPKGRPDRRLARAAAFTSSLALLAGCTTFGTNIKGSFACGAAEGGTCAPATVIDDRALARIAGESGDYRPAEPYPARAPAPAPRQIVDRGVAPVPHVKVLRIVFPAHVDRAGRYHETSVVRASVDSGAWIAATDGHGPELAQTNVLSVNPGILSQLGSAPSTAISSGEASAMPGAAVDPGAPSAQAVAAARARAKAKANGVAATDKRGAVPTASGEPAVPPSPLAAKVSTGPESAGVPASGTPAGRPVSFNPHVED